MTKQHIVFLTGAGVSVESGLSTFRGKDGLWTNEEWAYLASKEAVTCFVKKGSEVEQERDANTRQNKVYARKVMLIALTDANKVVKITASAE